MCSNTSPYIEFMLTNSTSQYTNIFCKKKVNMQIHALYKWWTVILHSLHCLARGILWRLADKWLPLQKLLSSVHLALAVRKETRERQVSQKKQTLDSSVKRPLESRGNTKQKAYSINTCFFFIRCTHLLFLAVQPWHSLCQIIHGPLLYFWRRKALVCRF